MSLTVAYDGKVARIIKGRSHNGRPQRWTIQVRYTLAGGEGRVLTVQAQEPAYLTELSPIIEAAIRADALIFEGVYDVRWTAISR